MMNLLIFALITLSGTVISVITENLLIFFFNLFFAIFGYLIIFFIKCDSRKKAYSVFSLFYLISLIYTSAADIIYVRNPYVDFFTTPDSASFFSRADQVSEYDNISDIFTQSTEEFEGTGGYVFSIGLITKTAKLLGNPHSIQLKLFSVFSGSMVVVLLFLMLLKILDPEKSFISALIFGFFSPVFFQSALILRDIHIMMFFSIMFYILISHQRSISGTFLTVILIYITYLFRPEHGLFSTIFLFFNLSYYSREKSLTKYIYVLTALIVLTISINKFEAVKQFENTTAEYTDFSERKGDFKPKGSSLGASLYNLPAILRVPSVAAFSQIVPLPIWAPVTTEPEANALRITQSFQGIFWYFVWWFLIAGFVYKKYRIYPKQMLYLLAISILLIFLATSEMNVRRIMSGYPVMFCFAAFSFYNLEKNIRDRIIILSSILYLSLHAVYLLIKI